MSTSASHTAEASANKAPFAGAGGREIEPSSVARPSDQDLYFLHLKNVVLELHKQSKRRISIDLLVDGARVFKFAGLDSGSKLIWDASAIYARSDSIMKFVIKEKHKLPLKTEICTVDVLCKDVLENVKDPGNIFKVEGVPRGKASLSILCMEHGQEWDGMKGSIALLKGTLEGHNALLEKVDKCGKFVEYLLEVGDPFLELDPTGIAKTTLGTVSTAFKMIEKCHASNDLLFGLLSSMSDILPFIQEVKHLTKLSLIRVNLLEMVKSIDDCCTFAIKYISANFFKKIFTSEPTAEIEELEKTFKKLKENYDRSMSLESFTVVLSLEERLVLQDLPIAAHADQWKGSKYTCMDNTRVGILQRLEEIGRGQGSQFVFVTGLAGSGKTSIATSLAQHLATDDLILACFFCRKDDLLFRDATRIIPTLAHKIASSYKPYASKLVEMLKADGSLALGDIGQQVQKLLVSPLEEQLTGKLGIPIVIVIDALDECDGKEDGVKKAIFEAALILCACIQGLKIFMTSRPDVNVGLESREEMIIHIKLEDYGAHEDIILYSRTRLNGMVSQDVLHAEGDIDAWIGTTVGKLSKQADGLFIWISTALDYISHSLDPDGELSMLVEKDTNYAHNVEGRLDVLYTHILNASSPSGASKKILKSVLGLVISVSANQPVDSDTLAKLGKMNARVVKRTIGSLRSVLYEDGGDPKNSVRVYHQSFADYLVNKDRCPEDMWIDLSSEDAQRTQGCLDIVLKGVKFNICQITTSHKFNTEIHNLEESIVKYIPQELQYSCKFWLPHCINTLCNPGLTVKQDLLKDIADLLRRLLCGPKCLYWIEILSLMQVVDSAIDVLHQLLPILTVHLDVFTRDIKDLTEDLIHFLQIYGQPIHQSSPHIYVSAISWLPQESPCATSFHPEFPNRVVIKRGLRPWLQYLVTSVALGSHVNCVTYTPDGSKFTCGTGDGIITVHNSKTGIKLCTLMGHTESVQCLVYSPDGKSLVSGSKDKSVIVWDVDSAQMDSESQTNTVLKHSEVVNSLAISGDGHWVAAGLKDSKIIIMNIQARPVHQIPPLTGHSLGVSSVVFSLDSKNLISGSDDRCIKKWDIETCTESMQVENAHKMSITCLAVTPDGNFLASVSYDETLKIWDMETLSLITEQGGHSRGIMSVCFSQNGEHIATCAGDRTIRLWSIKRGFIADQVLIGHTGWALSVAFSPDNNHIVSGSEDCTAKIWDINSTLHYKPISSKSLTSITSLAISPDGKFITTGNYEGEVQMWDIETGLPSLGTFAGHDRSVSSVAYSPDGLLLAANAHAGPIIMWDTANREIIRSHESNVLAICISSHQQLAAGCIDAQIRVWDIQTGATAGEPFVGHTAAVKSVAFSPDGSCLVSGSSDKTIRLWSMKSGVHLGEPLTGHDGDVSVVVFSHDGQKVASGSHDNTVRIWDIKTGAQLTILKPLFKFPVNDVAFSIDDQFIVGCTEYQTSDTVPITVWSVTTGLVVGEPFALFGHTDGISSVAFTSDGSKLITSSWDGTVRIWDFSLILEDGRIHEELCDKSVKVKDAVP
ncbi:WD40 repeat-like protein [Schizopora paradoxa]|uniref:WD40 repeat-like protein n=1 Tax=Schizopora paradoxa TaxID=27342 RepID=A0A0H2RLB1_9AGAM|nr:WD40 repeat-like protein [Schizopora paradoxa]